jgi:hypothetical protein
MSPSGECCLSCLATFSTITTQTLTISFSHLRTSKQSRMLSSLVDLLSINCGLIISSDLGRGETMLVGKELDEHVPLFAKIFEIGRRYKIMNPSKMRDTYGKLMYVCMDTRQLDLGSAGKKLNFVIPIVTVNSFLSGTGCEGLLSDPLLPLASIVLENFEEDEEDKSSAGHAIGPANATLADKYKIKSEAAAALREKYVAISAAYVAKYGESSDASGCRILTAEDIDRVVASVGDHEVSLAINAGPVSRMLGLLMTTFDPNIPDPHFSLDLRGQPRKQSSSFSPYSSFSSFTSSLTGFSSSYMGRGACLSHDHKTQFTFVKQSLMLWDEIMRHMGKLWYVHLQLSSLDFFVTHALPCTNTDPNPYFLCMQFIFSLFFPSFLGRYYADNDMLCNSYRLADTGQGYQRLQSCPKVGQLMSKILRDVQGRVAEPWVGLSVVHLGDRDVPNALMFIDKYTQVPRILTPIVQCLLRIPGVLARDSAFHAYVKQEWGSAEGLRLQILSDFFKHGFDGSGDDGGSCIDGRLTSTWNWCSKLHKKPYYHVFMFTGFQGFDGSDWKQD